MARRGCLPSKVTLDNFIKENGFEQAIKEFHIGRPKLRELCEQYQITVPKRGRPLISIDPKLEKFAMEYEANIGYKRMNGAAERENIPSSSWACRKLYALKGLFVEKKKIPKVQHTKRYVARYVYQAWHTDLHYLEKENGEPQKYLIAFIDDRSRLILHHAIIEQKTSYLCAKELLAALEKNMHPKTMIIDNGMEFVGREFHDVLMTFNIEEHRTHPYTPQENGKIERWWETIEKAKTKKLEGPYLDWIVQQYNTRWEHNAHKKFMGMLWTPQEAWDNQEKFAGQPDAEFIYEPRIPKKPLKNIADLAERLSDPAPLAMEEMAAINQCDTKSRITKKRLK